MAIIHLFFWGQSNTVGRAIGGPTSFESNFKVWDNENDRNDLSSLGSAWITPSLYSNPAVNSRNSLAFQAANEIAKARPNDEIRLVSVAMGGQAMSQWAEPNGTRGPLYNRALAVLQAASVPLPLAYIMRHQGETDDAQGAANYLTQWSHLKANSIADGLADASTLWVIGECLPQFTVISPILQQIANNDAKIGIARCKQYATSDNVHFNGDEIDLVGKAFAVALGAIPGSPFSDLVPVNTGARCLAKGSSVQSVPTNQTTRVLATDKKFDVGGIWDAVNSRLIPPKGEGFLSAKVRVTNVASGVEHVVDVQKNGQLLERYRFRAPYTSMQMVLPPLRIVSGGSDVFEVHVGAAASSGGTFSLQANGGEGYIEAYMH